MTTRNINNNNNDDDDDNNKSSDDDNDNSNINNNDNNENKSENKSSDGDNDNDNSNINNSSAGDNNDTLALCCFGNQGSPLSSTGVFAIGSVGIWGMAPFCYERERDHFTEVIAYCPLQGAFWLELWTFMGCLTILTCSSSSPAVGEISW